jgi:hypothetical protein
MKNITITNHTFTELVGNQRKNIITNDDSIRVGDTVYIRPESAGDDKKYAYASVEWITNTPAWRILGLKGIQIGTD